MRWIRRAYPARWAQADAGPCVARSASGVRTLQEEAGLATEILRRFVARQTGLIEGRVSSRGPKAIRRKMSKTVLVVGGASCAWIGQMRKAPGTAEVIRLPRVMPDGKEKRLDRVNAGKPFGQWMKAGMRNAALDEMLRRKDTRHTSPLKSTP